MSYKRNTKHVQLPTPLLKEAEELVKNTEFDFNTLNNIAWLKMLYARWKKVNKGNLEKFIDYLKELKK